MSKKGLFKKGFFKRFKKKDKSDETEKVKMKKSTIIIIEVICAVIIGAILIGIKFLITNKVDNNTVRLENQIVDNVSFIDFTLVYEDDISNLTVTLINYTEEDIELKDLTIKLYASDNTHVSEISAPLNMTLGPNQETIVENSTELDLTNVAKVEYTFE